MSYADDGFDVAVLELPYIFGTQPGRKPVWVFLVENIRSMKGVTRVSSTCGALPSPWRRASPAR